VKLVEKILNFPNPEELGYQGIFLSVNQELATLTFRNRPQIKLPGGELKFLAVSHYLLGENRNLGRTPKAVLMPRLKAMLARGEGKNLRPEKSMRQRRMTLGLYFNELIESGQVERFDKDMKRVYDVGSTEIARQGQQDVPVQAAQQGRNKPRIDAKDRRTRNSN